MRACVATMVATVFTEWYSTAARWEPPGVTAEFICPQCVGSPFAAELGLAEWPHSLTHELVTNLAVIAQGVGELLGVDGPAVDQLVISSIRAHAADAGDVLTECVEPRLNAYLYREAASFDREFGMLAGS